MWRRFERWCRIRLSAHPRLRAVASSLRRRLMPSRWAALASRHWDERVGDVEAGRQRGWLDWPLVEVEHVRPQISGDPEVYYLQYFFERHMGFKPAASILSLGCGGGNLERALIDVGMAHRVEGIDVSPESIRLANELAAQAGLGDRLRYRVGDIDGIELPEDTHDVVIAKMALHHLENLEHIYEQIRRTLKPGGLLMINEFVGPSRFQWTDQQLQLMNELLERLPKKARRAAPFARILRPELEDMKTLDPSESVRSAEVIPVLEQSFEVVDLKPYGGTLLHILLSHVMAGFDLEDEKDLSILRLMFLYERTLVEHQVIPSDFAFLVARPRQA
ncbi:MAG: class I SAM-dependent methyltransferase [Acidobacteriota bacterium]